MDGFLKLAIESQVSSYEMIYTQPVSDLTTNEYNAMLLGVVHGIIEGEGLTEVEACAGDVKTEASLAYTAFEDFLQHQWTAGAQTLLQIVEDVPTVYGACTNLSEDIATLENWATAFAHPASLPDTVRTNVTHNLLKLTRDLNKAKNEWKNETYYEFGTTLGMMLTIVTQPVAQAF